MKKYVKKHTSIGSTNYGSTFSEIIKETDTTYVCQNGDKIRKQDLKIIGFKIPQYNHITVSVITEDEYNEILKKREQAKKVEIMRDDIKKNIGMVTQLNVLEEIHRQVMSFVK